jgi:hypothetical protein
MVTGVCVPVARSVVTRVADVMSAVADIVPDVCMGRVAMPHVRVAGIGMTYVRMAEAGVRMANVCRSVGMADVRARAGVACVKGVLYAPEDVGEPAKRQRQHDV